MRGFGRDSTTVRLVAVGEQFCGQESVVSEATRDIVYQFIERTETADGKRKRVGGSFKDTPGQPGKGQVRLVDETPVKSVEIYLMEEAGFTSSSGSVRALSVNAKKELGSEER